MNTVTKRHKKRKLARRCGCKCSYCGKQLTLQTATLDHYIPKCRGGSNAKSNLRIACRDCNSAKADKLPVEWAMEQRA